MEVKERKILKKMLKDKEGKPYGMVIALNRNQLGYSMCNKQAGDKFNKEIAIKKAISRALSQKVTDYEFWFSNIKRHLDKNGYSIVTSNLASAVVIFELNLMQDRANRYYKEK